MRKIYKGWDYMTIKSSKAFSIMSILLMCFAVLFSVLIAYLTSNIIFSGIVFLFLLLIAARYWVSLGRTLIMDSDGCTVKFLCFSRCYKWQELQVKNVEIYKNAYGYRIPHIKGAYFSKRQINKPRWIKPAQYGALIHPFSFLYVNFNQKNEYGKFDYKCPDIYLVDESEFMKNMALWGVELTNKG